jgi:hypothetical protein
MHHRGFENNREKWVEIALNEQKNIEQLFLIKSDFKR